MLEETPKVTQLGDERFSRMQHFYDSDEVDPGTLEELESGSDGRVIIRKSEIKSYSIFIVRD